MQASPALVLKLRQPPGNLKYFLGHSTQELFMGRIPQPLWGHEGVARVRPPAPAACWRPLCDPDFESRVYADVDLGAML